MKQAETVATRDDVVAEISAKAETHHGKPVMQVLGGHHAHALRRKVIEEPYAGEWPLKVKFAFRFRTA